MAAAEEAIDAQVLVEVRPVYALAIAEKLVVLELLLRCPRQSRKPQQRNRCCPPIKKRHDYIVVREPDVISQSVESSPHPRNPQSEIPYPQSESPGFSRGDLTALLSLTHNFELWDDVSRDDNPPPSPRRAKGAAGRGIHGGAHGFGDLHAEAWS